MVPDSEVLASAEVWSPTSISVCCTWYGRRFGSAWARLDDLRLLRVLPLRRFRRTGWTAFSSMEPVLLYRAHTFPRVQGSNGGL